MSTTAHEKNARAELVILSLEHEGVRIGVTVSEEILRPENRELLGALFATAIDVVTRKDDAA